MIPNTYVRACIVLMCGAWLIITLRPQADPNFPKWFVRIVMSITAIVTAALPNG